MFKLGLDKTYKTLNETLEENKSEASKSAEVVEEVSSDSKTSKYSPPYQRSNLGFFKPQ